MNIIIMSTKNYLFIFDNINCKDWIKTFIHLVENRKLLIEEILKIDIDKEPKTTYRVSLKEKNEGHYYENKIICGIKDLNNYTHPFVHEEVHNIIFHKYGYLPCFIFDGIAEYVKNEIIKKKHNKLDYFKTLEEKKKTIYYLKANIIQLLTSYDYMEIRKHSKEIWVYTLAESFISFIISAKGLSYLKKIFNMYNKEENVFELITEDIINSWLQCIDEYDKYVFL